MLWWALAARAEEPKAENKPAVELSANVQPRAILLVAAGDGVTDQSRFNGSGFRVRRAALIATAKFGGIYDIRLKIESEKPGVINDGDGVAQLVSRPIVDDASLNIKLADAFQITAGQFKVPFLVQSLTGDPNVVSTERSIASDGFKFGSRDYKGFSYSRDAGVMLHGRPLDGKLWWQAGAFLGDGTNQFPPKDTGLNYVGRVSIEPLGKMELDEADLKHGDARLGIGVAASLNDHPGFDDAGASIGSAFDDRFGVELRFTASGFAFTAEGVYGLLTVPGADAVKHLGGYGTVSYAISNAHLLPAVRFALLDPDTSGDDQVYTVDVSTAYLLPDRSTDDKSDDFGHKAKFVMDYELASSTVDGPLFHQLIAEFNITR